MPFGLTKRAKNHQNWHRGVTMLYHTAQPSRALRHALSLLQLSMLSLETPRCLLHPKSLLQLFGISWSLSKPWTKNLSTLWYLLSFLCLYSLLCLTLRSSSKVRKLRRLRLWNSIRWYDRPRIEIPFMDKFFGNHDCFSKTNKPLHGGTSLPLSYVRPPMLSFR